MTGVVNTKYCFVIERKRAALTEMKKKKNTQLMDHNIIDWLNTGIYPSLIEMRTNNHHFYSAA